MERKTVSDGQPEQPMPLRAVTAEEFATRLQAFEKSYLWLVIGCGCGCAVAVLLAVMLRVWVGLVLAIAVAIAYRTVLDDLLKKQLGLSCRRNPDGVTVSVAADAPLGELWIPGRLLWLDVTELDGTAGGVTELHLPRSVRRIGQGELWNGVGRLLYEGGPEEWAAIRKDELPEGLEVACACGYPPKPVKERKKDSLT